MKAPLPTEGNSEPKCTDWEEVEHPLGPPFRQWVRVCYGENGDIVDRIVRIKWEYRDNVIRLGPLQADGENESRLT